MDPLDPLTEIINSGQAFYPAIALEKIIWVFIGIFFIGAISKSLANSMKNKNRFNKEFFHDFKISKNKGEISNEFYDEDK